MNRILKMNGTVKVVGSKYTQRTQRTSCYPAPTLRYSMIIAKYTKSRVIICYLLCLIYNEEKMNRYNY